MTDSTSKTKFLNYRSIVVPMLFGLALISLSPVHRLFSEWTGVMDFFSGRELVTGHGYHGWASQFYPPLFSLLLGIGSFLISGFAAGKLISVLSASLLLLVAYGFAGEFCQRDSVRLWTQIFLALSPLYVTEALLADNHMLDALFFNYSLLQFWRATKRPTPGRLLLIGALCGLAALTRYTSYILLLLPLSLLLFYPFRQITYPIASFYLGFAIILAPWWYYNASQNGSPLHNVNYLNVCVGVFGRYTNSLQVIWHWAADPNINGLADIVRHHPGAYLRNIFANLPACTILLASSAGALIPFAAPGLLESLYSLKPAQIFVTFGALLLSMLAVAQAYVNSSYLLPWTVLVVASSAAWLGGYLRRLEERFHGLQKHHAGRWAIGVLLACDLLMCARVLKAYQNEPATDRSLADAVQITQALKAHDPDLKSKVVMALDPARAYYAGAKYLATPFEYTGSVDGLVCYRGVNQRLRHYAPKYPSNMDESHLKADYLVYTRPQEDRLWVLHDAPEFSFLMDPQSTRIPSNFRLIYHSDSAVVYEVVWSQPAP